jgi:hypothetical protein
MLIRMREAQVVINTARNGGAWTGNGIYSSAAANNTSHTTTLGVLSGSEYGTSNTFDGITVISTDILAKYTYYGDTDFNGVVNFDDYVRTDNGFNNHLSGWLNGDFDLNGSVNFDDYVLIDLAFNTQSGTLRRALAFLDGDDSGAPATRAASLARVRDHLGQFGEAYRSAFLAAVPEPSLLFALGTSALILRRSPSPRRRRHAIAGCRLGTHP